MKLSDIMSAAGLAGFAEVALVLFLIVFVAVCVSVFSKKNTGHHERARFLPCDDAPRVAPQTPPSSMISSRASES